MSRGEGKLAEMRLRQNRIASDGIFVWVTRTDSS